MKSIITFIILCVFCSCVDVQGVSSQEQKTRNDSFSQQLEGFNLVGYSDEGKKEWDITGDTADMVGEEVAMTNVDANSYGEEQDLNLKARKGKIDKATGDVFLEDNVVITGERGAKIVTDTLNWQRGADLVKTNDFVTLEDADLRVQGTGLEARPSLKTAKLNSEVTAHINVQGAMDKTGTNRIQITSDGPMEIDQAIMQATFKENVVAIELATGRTLKADQMDVVFDQYTKKIKEIVCTGHVSLEYENNVTYSEGMIYKADEQRMVMTGRPKLVIDPGEDASGSLFDF